MSINYYSITAYKSKFSGELHARRDDALESDFLEAPMVLSKASVSEIMCAVLCENPDHIINQALAFLTDCAFEVKYYRDQRTKEAERKAASEEIDALAEEPASIANAAE